MALTPESINTTRVSHATGQYILENLECMHIQMEVMSAFSECGVSAMGGSEVAFASVASAALTGMMISGSGVVDVATGISALRNALSRRHDTELLNSGHDKTALSDEIARLTSETSEAMLRRISVVGGQFSAFTDAWQRAVAGSNSTLSTQVQHTMQDVWCSAVLPELPYLKDARYTDTPLSSPPS